MRMRMLRMTLMQAMRLLDLPLMQPMRLIHWFAFMMV